jgi:hypothetical protein
MKKLSIMLSCLTRASGRGVDGESGVAADRLLAHPADVQAMFGLGF